MASGTYTSTPSGIARGGVTDSQFKRIDNNDGQPSPVILALVLISLFLSSVSIYFSIAKTSSLSQEDKQSLKEIAEDLRAIRDKEIILTSPLKTTAYIEESFPATDIFPPSFSLPIKASVPFQGTFSAKSSTGQIVPLTLNETIEIDTEIPINSKDALSGAQIVIKKEIPIDTRFSATLRVSTVYGNELNDMIDKLEGIAD